MGSLPDRPDTPPRTRKMSKHVWTTSPRRSATHPRTSTKPSSKTLKDGKKPIAALASASFVSLRSIATITASNSHGDKVETDDLDADMDRAFTPDEDPFAALTPVSIISSASSSAKADTRSLMPLQNSTGGSLRLHDVPLSAPATLTTFNHYQILPPVPPHVQQQKARYD